MNLGPGSNGTTIEEYKGTEEKNTLLEKARKTFKPPKTLGACIDQAYELRSERLRLQREIDAIGAQETLMKDHIINTFSKTDINGAKGKRASCGIVPKRVPKVMDWNAVYAYILKTKSPELLQRRIHEKAWRERLEDGKAVPGVEAFDVITLSLRKL